MIKKEIDALTGMETTGHEWDGIKELNTPLPIWWLWVFYACILFALVWSILYPAWPIGLTSYTKGLLGYSTRETLNNRLAEVQKERAVWYDKFGTMTVDQINDDPDLVQFAMAGGKVLFADNCAPCHGTGGSGRSGGFPILVDDDWIWGGTLDQVKQTITYGIRNGNPDARDTQMPRFGADGILKAPEIADVADYVLWLSGQSSTKNEKGEAVFADNCAACHGEDGRGNADLGAPNLTDSIWLYGGTRAAIISQITNPRMGVMPDWHARLSDVEIKQLAVYVHSLGGGV